MPATTHPPTAGSAAPRRGRLARVVGGLLVALQLFAVGAIPVLDAQTVHVDHAPMHVEDAQQHDCPATHGAEECQLCQLLTSLRTVSTSAVMPALTAATTEQVPSAASALRRSAPPTDSHGSRAPPRR